MKILPMNEHLKIFFDNAMTFNPENIRTLNGIVGLYFIFSKSIDISYPFQQSKLLYIGMSEKRTNSEAQLTFETFEIKDKYFKQKFEEEYPNLINQKNCLNKLLT